MTIIKGEIESSKKTERVRLNVKNFAQKCSTW